MLDIGACCTALYFLVSLTICYHVRVVHGLTRTATQVVTNDLIVELRDIVAFAPEHLPLEIAAMEAIKNRFPVNFRLHFHRLLISLSSVVCLLTNYHAKQKNRNKPQHLVQAACFDTAFHATLPRVAFLLPLPRRYEAVGVRRYGFHGISYSFVIDELARIRRVPLERTGKAIVLHLGNGASACAMLNGKSVDTSMSFTPNAGLVMGTRSGDLDVGVFNFLAQREAMTSLQFQVFFDLI